MPAHPSEPAQRTVPTRSGARRHEQPDAEGRRIPIAERRSRPAAGSTSAETTAPATEDFPRSEAGPGTTTAQGGSRPARRPPHRNCPRPGIRPPHRTGPPGRGSVGPPPQARSASHRPQTRPSQARTHPARPNRPAREAPKAEGTRKPNLGREAAKTEDRLGAARPGPHGIQGRRPPWTSPTRAARRPKPRTAMDQPNPGRERIRAARQSRLSSNESAGEHAARTDGTPASDTRGSHPSHARLWAGSAFRRHQKPDGLRKALPAHNGPTSRAARKHQAKPRQRATSPRPCPSPGAPSSVRRSRPGSAPPARTAARAPPPASGR
ncbi:hypothetical protein FHX34_102507 [Actinoplanes teichomyceticus]|uniref:Uncharacterized protein n=1 Tax=Actinoplanes teichomyceticus TaxID=1867 RepID=A0A561WJC7_ACTTI|nr:hypothetical protein FHX34_102507 [Actinoplanes teichomyceticus]